MFIEQIFVHRGSNTPEFIEVFVVRTPCLESPLNVSGSSLAAASCSDPENTSIEQADLEITMQPSYGSYKIFAKNLSQADLEAILAAFVKLRDDIVKFEAEKQIFYAEERKRNSKKA